MKQHICDECRKVMKKIHIPRTRTDVYKGFILNVERNRESKGEWTGSQDSKIEVCSKRCLLHYIRAELSD